MTYCDAKGRGGLLGWGNISEGGEDGVLMRVGCESCGSKGVRVR